jgi:hypothetical protein
MYSVAAAGVLASDPTIVDNVPGMQLMFGPTTQQDIRVVGNDLHGKLFVVVEASIESNMRLRHVRSF